MAEDCGENGGSRRARLGSAAGYHPNYLASKHRISVQQARDLIAEVGHDRERLNVTAKAVRVEREIDC